MAKISENDAVSAAYKIAEPINKKMTEIEDQIIKLVTEYAFTRVPKEILKVFKSHSEYIQTVYSLILTGHGFNTRRTCLEKAVPWMDISYNSKIELSAEEAKVIQELVSEKEKLKDKYDTVKAEVKQSILTLGTHKRVQEDFPEAYAFLSGVKMNTQLMIQLQPVRDKVRCLTNTEDKEKKCINTL